MKLQFHRRWIKNIREIIIAIICWYVAIILLLSCWWLVMIVLLWDKNILLNYWRISRDNTKRCHNQPCNQYDIFHVCYKYDDCKKPKHARNRIK